jgi:hypothetical protein
MIFLAISLYILRICHRIISHHLIHLPCTLYAILSRVELIPNPACEKLKPIPILEDLPDTYEFLCLVFMVGKGVQVLGADKVMPELFYFAEGLLPGGDRLLIRITYFEFNN